MVDKQAKIRNTTPEAFITCQPSLDVSDCSSLEYLACGDNHLTRLDISGCTSLTNLDLSGLPLLNEVCVWTTPFPPAGLYVSTGYSPGVCFETDCDGLCTVTGGAESWLQGPLIYPNPFRDQLYVETDMGATVVITTLSGQQLKSEEIKGTLHRIDLSSIEKGIYLITVRTEDFVTTRKIMKW